jgi:hypothetical protein
MEIVAQLVQNMARREYPDAHSVKVEDTIRHCRMS